MGLTLIEAAKYENRLEHLAVLKTFSEGELLARLPFMNIAGSGLFYSAEQELPSVGFRAVGEVRLGADVPLAIEEKHPQQLTCGIQKVHRDDANRAVPL